MDENPTAPPPAVPPPATGPTPTEATAFLLTLALGSENLPAPAALEQLRQRVAQLRDPTAPDALDELSRHLPVLESLFQRFAADAVRMKNPEHRPKLLRAALQAHQAYARTFALLRTLAMQKPGQTAAVLDGGCAGPDD